MTRELIRYLREFIQHKNTILTSRDAEYIHVKERLLQQANRKTKKQIDLATKLLKMLVEKRSTKKSADGNILIERPCLNLLPYSPDQGDYYLVQRTYRRKTYVLKFSAVLGTFKWEPDLRMGDLFDTLGEAKAAYAELRMKSNSLVDFPRVKEVMRLVYVVKVQGVNLLELQTNKFWYSSTAPMEPYMFLNKTKAATELARLREKLVVDYTNKLNGLSHIELP